MKLKREGGGFRFFSKVPISSPNEEGKPWYQPELDPKYSTAAKELQEENEGLGRYSCFFFFLVFMFFLSLSLVLYIGIF